MKTRKENEKGLNSRDNKDIIIQIRTSRKTRKKRNLHAILESSEVMRQRLRNNRVCQRGSAQYKIYEHE